MNNEQCSLSVLVPVYNEIFLAEASIKRLSVLKESPYLSHVQVIIVDDCSTDGTTEILNNLHKEIREGEEDDFFEWIFLRHEKNQGKGKAIQTALKMATGDISIIHDADLEYNPKDILKMLPVFIEEYADAVYGSRFLSGDYRRALAFHHEMGNRFLTLLSNITTNLNLTDMETCYKAIRTPLFKSLLIESNDFRLEPELTAKLAKCNARIFEVPISYSGRDYQEGKKINWRDGIKALLAIFKYWFFDSIFKEDNSGSHILCKFSRATGYSKWISDIIKPHVGRVVFEAGAGMGNIAKSLMPRSRYFATDINPFYIEFLKKLEIGRPYLKVSFCDILDSETYPEGMGEVDTVLCLNVLEQVEDDRQALSNIKKVLKKGGKAIILVANNPDLFGSLDEALGHCRRYDRASFLELLEETGFRIEELKGFNRCGSFVWWLNSRILKSKTISFFQIRFLNSFSIIFRKIDKFLPFSPLSLIAVAVKE